MLGALGVLAASDRGTHGRGQVVDARIYESVLAVTESLVPRVYARGACASAPARPCPASRRATSIRPPTGYVLIAANQDSVFRRLVAVMGEPESPTTRYSTTGRASQNIASSTV